MNPATKKPRSLAFRVRVAVLLTAGVLALTQVGRLNRYVITEGILHSHSPDPTILHRLLHDTPGALTIMTRIWNSGKLPHRWEVINYLNRNLGQRPELLPVIGNLVLQAASDPDLTLRASALNLLRVIDHPEWRTVASAALHDPDPALRDIAHAALQKGGATLESVASQSQFLGPDFGDLVFHDFAQQPRPLSEFAGRPLLLHFFATWSPDCVKQIPDLVALRKLAPPDLAIVGVCVDGVPGVRHDHSTHEDCEHDHGPNSPADLLKAVERHVIVNGYNFPILLDTDGIPTAKLEGSELPVHVLLDEQHRLVRRYAGLRSTQTHDQIVRSLLGFKNPPAITIQLTSRQEP